MLELTEKNYYSPEANQAYMSASQYKAFKRCEAAALAELRGELERKDTTALLVGSFVDAYFSNELDQFKADHPECFKRDGTLKADFVHAEKIAKRLEADELARMLLSGQHQVIKTKQIGGVWFKCKIDSLLSEEQVEAICRKFPSIRKLVPFGGGMIVDLKIMRDFAMVWDVTIQEKVSFVNFWGYDTQGAIYQDADDHQAPFVIVAATKEAEPNIEAMTVPDDELSFCLDEVKVNAPIYDEIKRGLRDPIGCGKCEYCLSKKKLTEINHYLTI